MFKKHAQAIVSTNAAPAANTAAATIDARA
jgi:hypothetical protein